MAGLRRDGQLFVQVVADFERFYRKIDNCIGGNDKKGLLNIKITQSPPCHKPPSNDFFKIRPANISPGLQTEFHQIDTESHDSQHGVAEKGIFVRQSLLRSIKIKTLFTKKLKT